MFHFLVNILQCKNFCTGNISAEGDNSTPSINLAWCCYLNSDCFWQRQIRYWPRIYHIQGAKWRDYIAAPSCAQSDVTKERHAKIAPID